MNGPDIILESLASHFDELGFIILERAPNHVVIGGGLRRSKDGFGLYAHMLGLGPEYSREWMPGWVSVLTYRPDGVIDGELIELGDPTAITQIESILRTGWVPWRWVQRLFHRYQLWSRSLGGI